MINTGITDKNFNRTFLFFHSFVWCFKQVKYFVLKGYLRYKMIASQNVPSEAQIKNFVEKLYSVLKIFKFLYF